MLVKYTYPVSGEIYLPEHWPLSWDRYRLTWTVKDGKAESITVAVSTDDLSGIPRIEQRPQHGVAANIDMGHQPYHEEVESILRTACGFLGFFAQTEIDFERPTIAWEGETDEERAKLQMFSFKIEPGSRKEPLPISFDLVARCFLSATAASEKQIPLSFMGKGRREMSAARYIDAYYSHFFFLETQFAPGLSDPKKVRAKFKAAPEIANAMAEARTIAHKDTQRVNRMIELLKLSDESLIDHLVETRGRLHHHALPRKSGSWHPEKHKDFEADSLFLSYLTYVISQRQNLPILFDDAITELLKDAAKQEGAEYTYLIEVEGGADRYGLNGLPNLRITVPSRAPSHATLEALAEDIRSNGTPLDGKAVRAYTVKSSDGLQVFARYQNHTFPPRKT